MDTETLTRICDNTQTFVVGSDAIDITCWTTFFIVARASLITKSLLIAMLEKENKKPPKNTDAHTYMLRFRPNKDYIVSLIVALDTFNYIFFSETYYSREQEPEGKLQAISRLGLNIYKQKPKLHSLYEIAHLNIRRYFGPQASRSDWYKILAALPLPTLIVSDMKSGLRCYC